MGHHVRVTITAVTLGLLASTARPQPAMPVAPPDDDHDVPKEIAELIRQYNQPDTVSHRTDFDRAADRRNTAVQRNHLYDLYRSMVDKFEAAWKPFVERKAIVDKAVADADALVAAGKIADARAALEAVVTPVVRDAYGRVPKLKDRAFIDPRDAELPAAAALFKIARTQRDWNAAVAARVVITTLHRIDQDQAAERLLWIAADHTTPHLSASTDATKAWDKAAQDAVDGGDKLATSLDLGAAHVMISTETKLKKGEYVVMPYISHAKLTDKELSYSEVLQWRTPTECHKSNRVSWIDDNGTFHYDDDCTYKYDSKKVTLNAQLREPAPEWAAKSYGYTVIGKLVSPGPNWKLTEAIVLDLRYRD
jgi:hypothetical protein